MRIEFSAKTNKDYCMINTATFYLKEGGSVTLDRDNSFYSIVDGKLEMEWEGIYIWEVNEECIFINCPNLIYPGSDLVSLLEGAYVKLNLEDDADEDYAVTDIQWTISDSDGKYTSGTNYPLGVDSDLEPELTKVVKQRLLESAIEHCIAVDYDLITTKYDSWDEYLMETFGATEKDVRACGIELQDLW